MDITFICPHCGEVTLVGKEFVGQSGECRACGKTVRVSPAVGQPPRQPVLARVGAFFRWCNDYLGYVLLGVMVVGVLSLCVTPSFQTREVSRRMRSGNNLKLIGLAIQNYHDTYRSLPRAYWLTPEGERTLSWRVAISDFLSEQMILKEYKTSEPWDSKSNQELAQRQRYVFEQPGSEGRKQSETGYMVITGPGTLFEEGKDISFGDCTDGLANTILAVEVLDSGVNWLQPVDLDIRNMIFKINGGSFGISSPGRGGAQVLFADGSVRFLPEGTLESTVRAMMTRAGGEPVQFPEAR